MTMSTLSRTATKEVIVTPLVELMHVRKAFFFGDMCLAPKAAAVI